MSRVARENPGLSLRLISTPENKQRIGPDRKTSDPVRSAAYFPEWKLAFTLYRIGFRSDVEKT
jgi:hypothetical protein